MNNSISPNTPSFLKGPLMLIGWKREEDKLNVPEDSVTYVDYAGNDRDLIIRAEADTVKIERRSGAPPVYIRREGESIEIHTEGGREDVIVTRTKHDVRIDRKSVENDVILTLKNSSVYVDRPGLDEDVKVFSTKPGETPVSFPAYITWDGELIEQF